MNSEQTQPEMDNKNGRMVKMVVVAILLILPLVFLILKLSSSDEKANEQTSNAATGTIDIAAYENAVKSDPSAGNLINLSNAYISSNMAGKSVGVSLQAIELNPNSVIAYNNLGVAYTMIGQFTNGILACEKALQIDSSFQLAKNNLQWAQSERKNVLSALEKQTLVEEKERNADFYTNYGLNYLKLSEYDKAIEAFTKILNYDPKSIVAFNNIGTCFMTKGQYADAAAMFKKAVESNPDDQLSKNNLGWAMAEIENSKK